MAVPNYPGTIEVLPGVFVCEEDAAIYIADEDGEIVSWCYDEIKQDPQAWIASLMAVMVATGCGSSEVRDLRRPLSEEEMRQLLGFDQQEIKPSLTLVPMPKEETDG